jgi:hypothetical protein
MNDYCGLSSSAARAAAKLRRRTERATRREGYVRCGTYIRSEPHPDVTRSTRTDMTFVHLRSTKSREHMSRVTTPGLTARRVSPRVTHSFPPALAATKKDEPRRGQTRQRRRARARNRPKSESHRPCETCPSRLKVVNTKVQLRHLIIGHIIFIHERRTAAGEPRGRVGAGWEGAHQSPVGWNARGVDGEDRGGAGETAFDRRSAARDRGSARGDGEVRGQRRRHHPHSGMSRGVLGLGARSGEDAIEAQWVA